MKSNLTRDDAVKQLAKLAKYGELARATVAGLRSELFDKQLEFIDDPSRNKAALCTRRAGKTSMWSRYCIGEALSKPGALIRIWGISRIRVKQLLWNEFKQVAARHRIPVTLHETELTMRFSNGAEIRFVGADKSSEAEKKRGDKTWIEVILEAQLFGPFLRTLVEEVVEPCTIDLRGRICMEGTPGVVCSGYWYEVTGRNDIDSKWTSVGNHEGMGAGWNVHRWSVLDNPHMSHAREELEALKKRRRWTNTTPVFMREWQGKWTNDTDELFYRYDEERNGYTLAELQPWGPGWQHVLGWDLGSRDDMALVVWGYHPDHENLYEAFSWKAPGALSQDIVAQITALEKRGFNIIKKVADTGGGGRMFVEEVMARYSMLFEPAKKTEKYEHVRLMNDDFITAHIKVQRGSPLEDELKTLPKDPDVESTDTPKEDPRFANHCCDASLYSWRFARHFLHQDEKPKARYGTPEHTQEVEDRYVEKLKRQSYDNEHGTGLQWWDTADGQDFFEN